MSRAQLMRFVSEFASSGAAHFSIISGITAVIMGSLFSIHRFFYLYGGDRKFEVMEVNFVKE